MESLTAKIKETSVYTGFDIMLTKMLA